jgi:hypothetical protein
MQLCTGLLTQALSFALRKGLATHSGSVKPLEEGSLKVLHCVGHVSISKRLSICEECMRSLVFGFFCPSASNPKPQKPFIFSNTNLVFSLRDNIQLASDPHTI